MKNQIIKWLGGITLKTLREYMKERNTRELAIAKELEREKIWGEMFFNHARDLASQRQKLSEENLALGAENEQLEAELEEVHEALFEANRTIQHMRTDCNLATNLVTKKPKKKK